MSFLFQIVETMPQTEQVAEFVDTLGTFYEMIDDSAKRSTNKPTKHPNGSVANCNGEGSKTDREFWAANRLTTFSK